MLEIESLASLKDGDPSNFVNVICFGSLHDIKNIHKKEK